MISRIDYKGISWVDVPSLTPEDILALTKEFELSHFVAEELSRPSFRPRAENYGSHLYFILHLPLFDPEGRSHRARELDIVVGKKFLITVHQEPIEPMAEFFKHCELNLALRERCFSVSGSTDTLLYLLWKKLYDHLLAEIDFLQKKIDQIEERIFTGQEKKLIEDISYLRRDVLDFSRAVRPHDSLLESFAEIGPDFFGNSFKRLIPELAAQYRRLSNLLLNNKDTLETLYDTTNSLITHRSSEIIKAFTMLALLTFPLTLIATVFSIDAVSRPIVGQPNDFWVIIGIMAGVVAVMVAFFKYRRWI